MQIYCKNIEDYVDAAGGESLLEILPRVRPLLGFDPICALVNHKNESLHYQVFSPKQVEFLSASTSSGERVYVRSLCMMLYRAVAGLYPGVRLRIEHSISHGYYCRLLGDIEVTPDVTGRLLDEMKALCRRDIKFRRDERLTSDVIGLFEKQGLDDKVRLLRSAHELYTAYYEFDGVFDSYYGCLAPSTGAVSVFDLQPYKEGFLLLGRDADCPETAARPVAQEKMYEAFKEYVAFNDIVGVKNVGELNEMVMRGDGDMVINVSEALHNKKIISIADEIARRHYAGGARIVMVAGPSSSGKTTFTKRLAVQLLTNLLEPRMISLDDYFVDRDKTPRDESGDYDFESLYALDLDRFNADLQALLDGEEVELPYYNFETGHREYRGNRIRLNNRSVLLIEGIHGLNPELNAPIDDRMMFKVYVSALTTLSIDDHNWVPTSDNRLLRRIIRDSKYRNVSAAETIRRWPSVRRGEEKWIFPFQENADAMFNSSLLFELGVLKELGEDVLKNVPRDIPEYAEAYRLRKFLSYFRQIEDWSVPSTSLLREFLGGSSFRY